MVANHRGMRHQRAEVFSAARPGRHTPKRRGLTRVEVAPGSVARTAAMDQSSERHTPADAESDGGQGVCGHAASAVRVGCTDLQIEAWTVDHAGSPPTGSESNEGRKEAVGEFVCTAT